MKLVFVQVKQTYKEREMFVSCIINGMLCMGVKLMNWTFNASQSSLKRLVIKLAVTLNSAVGH